MNGFCGAVEGFKLLGDYAAILDKAIDRLVDLPPIADPVGESAKQTFVENYTSARDTATSAKLNWTRRLPRTSAR